jgi:hypothetical protein
VSQALTTVIYMGLLASLELQLSSDLPNCGDAELRALSARAQRGVAVLEGFITRIAGEARRRDEAGSSSAPAGELIRGDGGISRERADDLTARAAVGESLPKVGAAIGCGEARSENAALVAATLGRMSTSERQRLGHEDAELAHRAANDSPEVFARHLKRRARELRDTTGVGGVSAAERERAASHLAMGRRANGRWWLSADLDGEWGAVVNDRLRARARQLAGDAPITGNHLAQALHDLIAGFGDASGSGGGGGGLDHLGSMRMGVGYIVDAATLFNWHRTAPEPRRTRPAGSSTGAGFTGSTGAGGNCWWASDAATVAETWEGEAVGVNDVRRLACDADLYAIMIDRAGRSGPVVNTRHSANREQRLALRALYPTCPLDGATPFGRCEIHHVNQQFSDGGPTELANLVPIAPSWHHNIHDRGWSLIMGPYRTLELRSPDGTLQRTIPPPTPITRQRE